jgi:hypothetical protein
MIICANNKSQSNAINVMPCEKKNMKQHWALAKTLSSGSIYSGISDFSEQLSERTV